MTGRVDTAALEAALAAATPGPWRIETDGMDDGPEDFEHGETCGWIHPIGAYSSKRADNELIVAAVAALPALLAIARAAERLNALHPNFLGLPMLAEDKLDEAVEAWAALRAALAGTETTP